MPPAVPVHEEPVPSREEDEGMKIANGDGSELHKSIARLDDGDAMDGEFVVSQEEVEDMESANSDGSEDLEDIKPAQPAPRKRGRPSKSASASRASTPAKGKDAAKKPAASARKRKAADEGQAAPATKRAGRGPTAASRPTSTRKAAIEANKEVEEQSTRKAARTVKPVNKTPRKRGRPKKEIEEEDDADSFIVEAIVKDMVDADTMEHMFYVKWEGWADVDNTWEPKKNLKGCEELISAYQTAKKKAGKSTKTAKGSKTKK